MYSKVAGMRSHLYLEIRTKGGGGEGSVAGAGQEGPPRALSRRARALTAVGESVR